MGIQILTIIGGEDCRGDSDGKGIAAVALALAASSIGEQSNRGVARVTRVDFRTKQVVADDEYAVIPTPAAASGSGIDAFMACVSDSGQERHDHAAAIAAARQVKAYLDIPAHQAALVKGASATGIEVDEDHISAALYDLDHMIQELTRAERAGLSYRLDLSC